MSFLKEKKTEAVRECYDSTIQQL